MRVRLILGWVFLGLAGLALIGDIWRSVTTGDVYFHAVGEIWYRLHAPSLNLLQAVVQRYLFPFLWDGVIVTLLRLPMVVVLAAPGLALLWFDRRRRRKPEGQTGAVGAPGPDQNITKTALRLTIRSVNIGRPQEIGQKDGKPVVSGIKKAPVAEATLKLSPTNLAGDGQADREAHGGPDKAVYAYPVENFPYWLKETGLVCAPAIFGENLTVEGADEEAVRIGDVFAWGEARLAVSQPRRPCYKLAMQLGREDINPRMMQSGRCGWYLRVLRGADVPVAGQLERIETDLSRPTVRDMMVNTFSPRTPSEEMEALAATPDLAPAWRAVIRSRISTRERIAAGRRN